LKNWPWSGARVADRSAIINAQDNSGGEMAKLARDVMTADPVCCSPNATLDQVAQLMAQNNCGEIPVVDVTDQPVGVITDRDIVCRVVAEGKNPGAYTAESCMTSSVIAVRADAPMSEVVSVMEDHQIRRVLVVDDGGSCMGIISQADIAAVEPPNVTAELVSKLSRDSGAPSR
jgi:CBS domain-containing protein